jgi:hypothetical protein
MLWTTRVSLQRNQTLRQFSKRPLGRFMAETNRARMAQIFALHSVPIILNTMAPIRPLPFIQFEEMDDDGR